MDKKTKQLAEQAGFVLDELPDTVLQPLEKFSELLRTANTREVVALCANTINRNLNEQKQQARHLLIQQLYLLSKNYLEHPTYIQMYHWN